MSFLDKEEKAGEYTSVISEQCQFQGTLDLQGSIRIDGSLEGNIDNAKLVTISKTGSMKGDLSGLGAVIIGKMEGDICVEEIEILSEAHLKGNIRTKSILIEKGAKVNATITVVTEEEEDPKGEEIIEEKQERKEKKK